MPNLKISIRISNMGKNWSESMANRKNKALNNGAAVMSSAAWKIEWEYSELLIHLQCFGSHGHRVSLFPTTFLHINYMISRHVTMKNSTNHQCFVTVSLLVSSSTSNLPLPLCSDHSLLINASSLPP